MLYLEMAANQEHVGQIRGQVEYNRLEARLAQARLSHNAGLPQTRPYTGLFTNTAWRIEQWLGAGW
jgi:hypothetical protein